jgi:peptide/nickel transport system permease protein
MSALSTASTLPPLLAPEVRNPPRLVLLWRYTRRNPSLAAGLAIALFLLLFCVVGAMRVNLKEMAYPLAAMPNRPPSAQNLFGTDSQGRDLLAATIAGTILTLRIGMTAGAIGLGVGTILAFIAAYYRGIVDTVIRGVVDVLLTVPGLMILVIIAATLRRAMSVEAMALVVASLAWLNPTRNIRSQVLSMRERPFLQVARLSGMNGIEIIFKEMMPNLLPYLAASFVGSVTSAIFASIGLEALGLGPLREPTLGMTIYWVLYYSALLKGMWWWVAAPVTVIVLIFVSLFLIGTGLDEVANPRVRRTE